MKPDDPKMTFAPRKRQDLPLHALQQPEVPKMTFGTRSRQNLIQAVNGDPSPCAELVNQMTDEQAEGLCELLMARLGWHRDKQWSLRK